MLAITTPHVDAWNIWFDDFDNDPAQLPDKLAVVNNAAHAVGRDGSEIAKTAALLVQLADGSERRNSRNPLVGQAAMIDALGQMQAVGIDHVQLVLDPITIETVEAAAIAVASFR